MFNRQANNIANAVRLLVAMSGMLSAPGLKSGLGVFDTIRKVAARPPKSLTTMADELDRAARTVFDSFRELPVDADIRFVQMVEIGLLTPAEITEAGMDAEACAGAMLAKLKDETDPSRELRHAGMQSVFRAIVEPTLGRLFRTKEYAADLTPAFMTDMLQTARRSEDKLDNVAERLDDLEEQTRGTLDLLAYHFGQKDPEAMSLQDVRGFLNKKAQDYHALKEEVEALRGTLASEDDAFADVDKAIERLDLDEANRLLSDLRETATASLQAPLERNARILEAQARVAFLKGDPASAKQRLLMAADSLAVVSEEAYHRKRFNAARLLHEHGLSYGGDAIAQAIELAEETLPAAMETVPTAELLVMHHAYAAMLENQGRRLAEPDASQCFDRAAQIHELIIQTLAMDHGNEPIRAAALTSLAGVLTEKARRQPRESAYALLQRAQSCHEEAIQILDPKEDRGNWISAKSGLAATLRHLSGLDPEASPKLLDAAATALNDIDSTVSREEDPEAWRINLYNLANIYAQQAEHADGSDRRGLLTAALQNYGKVLDALSPGKQPVTWASTLFARALCLSQMGAMGGEDGLSAMTAAVSDLLDVYEVQTRVGSTFETGATLRTLATVHENSAALEICTDPVCELEKAAHFLELAHQSFLEAGAEQDALEIAAAQERVAEKLSKVS
ncbi:hypothetical protein [Roseibium sp.]|uniref:hypothetical protein n=1 Tax=Roseibium sp. TaxID=1936156 RepID=UPI003BAC83D1